MELDTSQPPAPAPPAVAVPTDVKRKRTPPRARAKGTPDPVGYDKIINLVSSYDDERTQALVAFLYLTGARICEVIKSRDKSETPGVKRNDVVEFEDHVVITLYTEKNAQAKADNMAFRDIAVPLKEEYARSLWAVCRKWIEGVRPTDELFPGISRNLADYYIRKGKVVTKMRGKNAHTTIEYPVHAHYLRHCRATDLVSEHGFSDSYLKTFFNWTTTSQAARYVHLNARDMLKQMTDHPASGRAKPLASDPDGSPRTDNPQD